MQNDRARMRVAFALAVAVMAAAPGCRKVSEKPTWDIDLLAPLVRTTFTLRDLLADSLIQTDAQGAVTLVYSGSLFEVDLDTVLTAPDTTFTYSYALPFPGPLDFPPGVNFFNQVDVQRFDLDELALRDLILREGRLELRLTNMVQSRILGSIQIPAAQFAGGGNTLLTEAEAGTPAAPTVSVSSRDLAGARFDLRGPQMNAVNTLQTILGAQLDPDGQGATVTDQDSLIIEASYFGLVPEYARGFFGQREVSAGPTEDDLGLFDALVGGTLDLDEAHLVLKVTNGFGVDLQLRMHELVAINTRTGASVPLQHALFNGPLNLTRAIDLGTGPQPTTITRTISTANSNITSFIEALPDRARYAIDLSLNPLGDISNGNDFLYHSSELKADIDLEVPLRLIANELTLQSTSTPDLPGTANGHALQSGTLNLFATNGFPMSARIVLDLIDDEGEVVASIPVDGTVASGVLGPNGLVSQRANSELNAQLDEALVGLLYSGTRLRTRVAFTTVDQSQHLRLLDSYALDLQVTLEASYLVNGDE